MYKAPQQNKKRKQGGFTLIELLTTLSLIGILAALSIQSFTVYRQNAEYTRARSTLRDGRSAIEAAIVTPDISLPFINMDDMIGPGAFAGATGEVVPGLEVPVNVKFTVYNDPDCADAACIQHFIQSEPCNGTEYTNWTRMGDGTELLLENVAGAGGC
jgi:prepilin-type N-terminal cleavage/methylation domain-containing protein